MCEIWETDFIHNLAAKHQFLFLISVNLVYETITAVFHHSIDDATPASLLQKIGETGRWVRNYYLHAEQYVQ